MGMYQISAQMGNDGAIPITFKSPTWQPCNLRDVPHTKFEAVVLDSQLTRISATFLAGCRLDAGQSKLHMTAQQRFPVCEW